MCKTTVEACSCCGERFRWDPSMYRLCAACLYEMERLAASVRADNATVGTK